MTPTDRKIIAVFVVVSLALRLACIPLNTAEYTDGILQITAFTYGQTFWPPFYTALVQALNGLTRDPELAGKLISIFSSALLIVPLYWSAHRLAGRRAAVYALFFYMTDAIAWRWSIRVMSDALFELLFFSSAVLFCRFFERATDWFEEATARLWDEPLPKPPEPDRLHAGFFLAANALGSLAFATRLQGVFLIFLAAPAMQMFQRHPGGKGWRNGLIFMASVLVWLAPVFLNRALFGGHGKQFEERAGTTLVQMTLIYWNVLESFLLLFPYFITIPVFVLFAGGLFLFLRADVNTRTFARFFLIFGALILLTQMAFQSFQERYLLPLIPFMMVLAGAAAARWEDVTGRRGRPWVRGALAAILLLSFMVSPSRHPREIRRCEIAGGYSDRTMRRDSGACRDFP